MSPRFCQPGGPPAWRRGGRPHPQVGGHFHPHTAYYPHRARPRAAGRALRPFPKSLWRRALRQRIGEMVAAKCRSWWRAPSSAGCDQSLHKSRRECGRTAQLLRR